MTAPTRQAVAIALNTARTKVANMPDWFNAINKAAVELEIKTYVDQYNQDFELEMTVEELVGDDPHSFYISTILSENETETAMLYEYVIQNTSFVSREEINQRRLLF